MKDIFVCHSKEDKKSARQLVTKLETEKQLSCGVSSRDVPTEETEREVVTSSKVFVLVLSENARNSPEVIRQLKIASENGIPILPFKITSIREDLGIAFLLQELEWVDAFGDGFDTAFDLLLEIYAEKTNGEPPVKRQQKAAERKEPMSKQVKYTLAAIGGVLLILIIWYFSQTPEKETESTTSNLTGTTTNTSTLPYKAPEGSEPIMGTWRIIDYEDSRTMTPEERAETEKNIELLKKSASVIFKADGTFIRTGFTEKPQIGKWEFDAKKLIINLIPDGSNRPEQVSIVAPPDSTFTIVVNEKAPTPTGQLEDVTTKITFRKQ